MAVNDLHEQKDRCASLVRDVGRTMEVRASQLAKALPPMVVHELGSTIEVREEQW